MHSIFKLKLFVCKSIHNRWKACCWLGLIVFIPLNCLISCGFQLRGTLGNYHSLPTLEINNQLPSAWQASFERFLERAEVNTSNQGEWQLTLENLEETRRVASLNTRAKVAEYELTLTLHYSVSNAADEPLTQTIALSVSRSYRFNETQVVGKEQEELLLKKQMQDLLYQRLLRHLNQLNRSQKNAS